MKTFVIDFFQDLLEEVAWEDVAERPDYLEQLLADYEDQIFNLKPEQIEMLRKLAYSNPAMRDKELIEGLRSFPAAVFLFPALF
ncbi:MAG: hypothetical protein N2319_03680 [Candidatus Kapabacteria bacterium]|nr:hypothetical protein [Candidatus Kapabacteria bacterium]